MVAYKKTHYAYCVLEMKPDETSYSVIAVYSEYRGAESCIEMLRKSNNGCDYNIQEFMIDCFKTTVYKRKYK